MSAVGGPYIAVPQTLRTLGTTQRLLLMKAREQDMVRATTATEQRSLIKLHDRGLLDRGVKADIFWINDNGRNLPDGR